MFILFDINALVDVSVLQFPSELGEGNGTKGKHLCFPSSLLPFFFTNMAPSKRTNHDTDVVIAGAGPVGLSLAIELKRHNIDFRILDKEPSHKEISKALILHIRTLEILKCMGVFDKGYILDEAIPLNQMEVQAYGEHVGAWKFERFDSPFPKPLIIGQNRTEYNLQRYLESLGQRVEWKTELLNYEEIPDGDSIFCTIRNPDNSISKIRTRYLIGCDGAHSIIRKNLEAKKLTQFDGGAYSDQQIIQADCKIRWNLPKGSSHIFLTDVGLMMVMELPNDFVRIVITLPDENPPNKADPTLNEIEAALRIFSTIDNVRLSQPTWLARYRTSHRMSSRHRVGRIFLAGDSAHIHVPLGGQGMNTGIHDAFNLGWKLCWVIKGIAPDSLLDSYQAERHPIAEHLLKSTDISYRRIAHPNQFMKRFVSIFGSYLMGSEYVQDAFAWNLEELTIHYHKSAWVSDLIGTSEPKAGGRFGDCSFVHADTQETNTLFNYLSHKQHFTGLIFPGIQTETSSDVSSFIETEKLWEANFPDNALFKTHIVYPRANLPKSLNRENLWVDALGHMHDKFGVIRPGHPTAIILRPDLVVGYRSSLNQAVHSINYLKKFILK